MEDYKDDIQQKARREERRKKRIRTTVTAYVSLAVVLLVLGGGVFFGVTQLNTYLQANRQPEEVINSEVPTEEPIVLTEPDSVEIPSTPESAEPVKDPLEEEIDGILAGMTTQQKVAALFLTSPEALTGVGQAVRAGDGTKTALEEYPVGGLLYSAKNIQSRDQFTEMLTNTKTMSAFPIFLAVTEEGGKNNTVAGKMGITAIESAETYAQGEDGGMVSEAYLTMGAYLAGLGMNLNLAPVADLATNAENVNHVRMFGSDTANASKMVTEAVDSLNAAGIDVCLKFFPGEGEVTGAEKITNRTADEMRAAEFLTFQAGIEAGATMVMVSDISAPAVIGSDVPACLSDVMMTQILRTELGYEGIIITSDLADQRITSKYASGDAAVMAIQAGADMILNTGDFKGAYDGVLAAVESSTITMEQLDQAVRRIYRVKCQWDE